MRHLKQFDAAFGNLDHLMRAYSKPSPLKLSERLLKVKSDLTEILNDVVKDELPNPYGYSYEGNGK